MKVLTHRKFDRAFRKLRPVMQRKFYEALELYRENRHDSRLRSHALVGRFLGYRSMDITGDCRVIFEEVDDETIHVVNIGTHSQLYG